MKPTQRQVAEATGLTQAAVSLALRGHPRISQETREKVLNAAKELGYQVNPWFSEMARRRPHSHLTTIAYIHSHTREELSRDDYFVELNRAAPEFGFQIDSIATRHVRPERVESILDARNIHAVVFAQTNPSAPDFNLDLSRFCIVQIGLNKSQPLFHRVIAELADAPRLCVDKAIAKGCRRIAINLMMDERSESDQVLLRACHGVAQTTTVAKVKVYNTYWSSLEETKYFKPILEGGYDGIISSQIRETPLWVPASKGIYKLNLLASKMNDVGPVIPFADMAFVTLRRLRAKLTANERGLPRIAETICIPLKWCDQSTLAQ